MVIDNKYGLGQTVYLITDTEQRPRIVTAVNVLVGGGLRYALSQGVSETWHYEAEITDEVNILTKVSFE